ncbi:tRNA (adenosine(37)-N6)-threonylcarbamoyltransferase complex ATPase subunit type 1 TsaE [Actinomadura xylanilytica]|uniref:tRNA (adenosine(37)-N6)-threonylcarbamoyltransferase complex ATPase subunit type 1 TsaE n=1 Tax=Actinomadura xylanilytica TaxID=887459 RepID=UPI00255AF732|nr:tRNA (adenosine(37)-N6)-threonylcarbamoyltransferase complex ATPase subunit type 1 TsaE [Actinomadura xylanilytica]MDL4776229.1 tRNA (adenosine(37)-N6)-threonylcarbamoyltransferase complex ATPase subunit type 1 TsaE [Actinomadura xylanilytica]
MSEPGTVTVTRTVPDAADMRDLGVRLAGLLRPGDLLVLTGDLGAGKTTLTQGIGEGLKVRGPITSPTFVIARVHPSLCGGPPLVHVDAYRLGGFAELDDLDLDASADASVTVVEWGEGLAEGLADARLEMIISRGDESTEERAVKITGVGERWAGLARELH